MPGMDTLNITAANDADIIANTMKAIIYNNENHVLMSI